MVLFYPLILLSLIASFATSSNAFYLPGAAPNSYLEGDKIPVVVNSLSPQVSQTSQLHGLISYDYYSPEFHFCQPQGGPKKQPEALGAILFGDRMYNSPFEINMMQNETCKSLCQAEIPAKDAKFVNQRITDGYVVSLLVDALPGGEMKKDDKSGDIFYSMGFELGDMEVKPIPAFFNHLNFFIEYRTVEPGVHQVVGVVVWPQSIDSARGGGDTPDCSTEKPLLLSKDSSSNVHYTYSVIFTESETPWSARWDKYLHVFDPRIHWFSLVNSVVIASFLCAMVGMIIMRTVHRDISRYNAMEGSEDLQEDFGWKLVHGEVFRPPVNAGFLSILLGSGAQLIAMCLVTLFFATLGFLSPSNRGSLSNVMIICWTFFSFFSGYWSCRIYLTLHGQSWKKNALSAAILFPTALFAYLNLLNFFLIFAGSSGAVPFGTMIALIALWFLISIPLSFAGSWFALKKGRLSFPVGVNQIPRQIPILPKYLELIPSTLMAGILPFGAAFIEIYFGLSSLFSARSYYAFGFLALTFIVVALTTATVTMLMVYFALCAEDHRWHWRAFITGGGSAFWLFAYGLLYWATRLSLPGIPSKVLYVAYLALISLVFFLVNGAIGYLSTLFFLRRIYSRIRVD